MPWPVRIQFPMIMGILNVTPDSFSDGGRFLDPHAAIERAKDMYMEGAHVIDMGAESTRPGSSPVPPTEQLRRLLPVVTGYLKGHPPLQARVSIDTSSAAVAEACLDAGATMINDVTALRGDPLMLRTLAKRKCDIVLMHMRGKPRTMQQRPKYGNVVKAVSKFFQERIQACEDAGIARKRLILDPGIGFGKTLNHNLTLLKNLADFKEFGCPLMIGASRKAFLGTLTNEPVPENRAIASVAVMFHALERGGVTWLRVHDIKEHVRAAAVLSAILKGKV
jgi:dihydropteroate synthase